MFEFIFNIKELVCKNKLQTLALKELDQIKALFDPLHHKVLEVFCRRPATTVQAAQALDKKPHRLYHHVSLLEDAGLIELVETRQNRGTIEKYFQGVAKCFVIDQPLLAVSPEDEELANESRTLAINAIEVCLNDARNHLDHEPYIAQGEDACGIVGQFRIRASDEAMQQMIRNLQDLLLEFQDANEPQAKTEYSGLVAIFPVEKE